MIPIITLPAHPIIVSADIKLESYSINKLFPKFIISYIEIQISEINIKKISITVI